VLGLDSHLRNKPRTLLPQNKILWLGKLMNFRVPLKQGTASKSYVTSNSCIIELDGFVRRRLVGFRWSGCLAEEILLTRGWEYIQLIIRYVLIFSRTWDDGQI
jgi:hypothetical protein